MWKSMPRFLPSPDGCAVGGSYRASLAPSSGASRRTSSSNGTATFPLVQRALAATVLALLVSACGADETEQSSDGTEECIANLTQAIGSDAELLGATWSPDGRRIAFS